LRDILFYVFISSKINVEVPSKYYLLDVIFSRPHAQYPTAYIINSVYLSSLIPFEEIGFGD
jgi:hypothetical protein